MDTKIEKSNSKVRQHYSHEKADARQDKLRQEAEARQREHDKLTTAQKLAKVKARVAEGFGNCKRELERLSKRLEWEKAQKVTAAAKPAPLTEEQKAQKAVKRSKDAAVAAAR